MHTGFDAIVAAVTPQLPAIFARFLDETAAESLDVRVFRLAALPAINVLLCPVLDGGVTLSRRLDPHGKSLSDVLLSAWVEF